MRLFSKLASTFITAALVAAISTAASAQDCEAPLCRGDETYRRGGVDSTGPYGVCGHCNWLGHCSHYLARCPSESTLDPERGVCVLNLCSSCGSQLPLCEPDEAYTRSGADATGPYGVCSSGPTPPGGYLSHRLARCREGWTLVPDSGMCRRDCALIGPGIDPDTLTPAPTPIEPPVLLFPDLTLRRAWLRNTSGATMKTVRAKQPYYACFEVANIGAGASGVFHVGGGGLGVPTPPEQAHANLAPGASREGCLYYSTTPAVGTWRLGLKADSRNAVTESRENNNERTLTVRVRP